jgi:hypothetical protein
MFFKFKDQRIKVRKFMENNYKFTTVYIRDTWLAVYERCSDNETFFRSLGGDYCV